MAMRTSFFLFALALSSAHSEEDVTAKNISAPFLATGASEHKEPDDKAVKPFAEIEKQHNATSVDDEPARKTMVHADGDKGSDGPLNKGIVDKHSSTPADVDDVHGRNSSSSAAAPASETADDQNAKVDSLLKQFMDAEDEEGLKQELKTVANNMARSRGKSQGEQRSESSSAGKQHGMETGEETETEMPRRQAAAHAAGVREHHQESAVQQLFRQLNEFRPKNKKQARTIHQLKVDLARDFPDEVGTYSDHPGLDEHILTALGGGTGARVGGTGDPVMDHHLVQRMHTQDLAVLIVLFVIYLVTLFFGWSITYRMSHNNSPVRYYTNPRYHQLATERNDVDGFLSVFNGASKEVRLEVAGFVETPPEAAHVEWRGSHYQTTFFFSLDLSQWVVPAEEVSSADRAKLRTFLGTTNSLETVDIHKDVSWNNWEELATNIKHTIRRNGFHGRIDVALRGQDLVRVYQNVTWANFMHNRTTKALFALSIVGGLLYVPYMWLRCRRTSISAKFKVECAIGDYWNLIHDKLSAQGFDAGLR